MGRLHRKTTPIDAPAWYRPNDPLRTPVFAAKALGVNRSTIHRWIAKGIIAFIEVGPFRKKRIYDSEIARLRVEHLNVA